MGRGEESGKVGAQNADGLRANDAIVKRKRERRGEERQHKKSYVEVAVND